MRTGRNLLSLVLLAVLAGCGLPGAPQPPSLGLARPVDDLRAARQGSEVVLQWTPPGESTDGARLRRPAAVRVCRRLAAESAPEAPAGCAQVVAELPPGANAASAFRDTLPAELLQTDPARFAVYTVEALNDRDRSAGPSNAARVSLVPTAPAPAELKAEVTAQGVSLSWTSAPAAPGGALTYSYRVLRRDPGGRAQAKVAEVAAEPHLLTALDTSFEWEKTYDYSVVSVTTARSPSGATIEVLGAESPAARVVVRDVFPPAVPTGVEAVFTAAGGERTVDLTWIPSSDADLAGYHVYRREAGGEAVRLSAELLKTPAFRDAQVAAGRSYLYSVSAVDVRGNESPRSAEASEKIPEP